MSILPRETEAFFHRLSKALPHSGPVTLLHGELVDPLEVNLKLHAAVKGTTGLHRAYFGDIGFARRVYEAQLSYTKGFINGATTQHRAERTPRPNISQRVLAAKEQAKREMSNVG